MAEFFYSNSHITKEAFLSIKLLSCGEIFITSDDFDVLQAVRLSPSEAIKLFNELKYSLKTLNNEISNAID